MIIDANAADAPLAYDADVCVIGGGVMGVAIARELVAGGKRVVVVESGGDSYDADVQNLCEMDVTGMAQDDDPLISRLRFLGGSSNHWGGWNIGWSEAVLADWPTGVEDVHRYYDKVAGFFGLRSADQHNLAPWGVQDGQYYHNYGPNMQVGVRQVRPFKVWLEYRDDLANAPDCTVLTHANLVDFGFSDDRGSVHSALLRTLDGKELQVRSQEVVLACGGLENPVVLLNIDRANDGIFTRKTQAIGTYYMDHLHLYGDLVPISCFVPRTADWTDLPHYRNGTSESARSYFVRAFLSMRQNSKGARAIPNALSYLGDFHAQCTYTTRDRFETGLMANVAENGQLKIEMPTFDFAPTPTASSHITLSGRQNRLGQRRGALHWNILEDDLLAVYDLLTRFEAELASCGLARLRMSALFKSQYLEGTVPSHSNGRHHMGATRMSLTGATGVVDPNCRVHGMTNLYIAGASVFPSYNWPGPTFTATALGFRLADHLLQI